jgi:hypothetical protein
MSSSVTYEGVTLCALAQLMGLARARLSMWRHIHASRTV